MAGETVERSDARIAVLSVMSLGAISTFIAFTGSNWLASDSRRYGSEFSHLGLWQTCSRSYKEPDEDEYSQVLEGCRWLFRDEYFSSRDILLPAFLVATQIFYSIGFLLMIIVTIGMTAVELCSITDQEALAMRIFSFAMFLSGLCCTIAVITFGMRADDSDWIPDTEHNILSWSFALAVVSCFCHWFSAILFIIESRIIRKRASNERYLNDRFIMM